MAPDLTQEETLKMFKYIDGELYVKTGYICSCGYNRVRVKGKQFMSHRVIFLMHHGYLPKLIDHIDGNRLNNNITNLRPANKTQNSQNSKKRIDNISGFKNINWDKENKKWQVRLTINKKPISFGYYDDLELADLVAQEARNKFYGDFARHN